MKKLVSLVLTLGFALSFCAAAHAEDLDSTNNGETITGAVVCSNALMGTGNTFVSGNSAEEGTNISDDGELILLSEGNEEDTAASEDEDLSLLGYEYTIGPEDKNLMNDVAESSSMYMYITPTSPAKKEDFYDSNDVFQFSAIYKSGKGEMATAILKNGFEMTYKANGSYPCTFKVYVDGKQVDRFDTYVVLGNRGWATRTIKCNELGMHKVTWEIDNRYAYITDIKATDMCDTDRNGVVNVKDAIATLIYKEGITAAPREQFDMDGNGVVDRVDAAHILKYLAKIY